MLEKLGWRILEQRRTDFRLVLFYKIVYGYVAVPLPTYVILLTRTSRTSHPLAYRQLYAGTDYYKYSFYPLAVVQWNNFAVPIATLTSLDSFKEAGQSGVPQQTINVPPLFLSSLFLLITV